MTTVEQALLIILASFLALFLFLGILISIKLLQVLGSLKKITAKAEHIADQAETISDIFVKTSGPLAVGRLLAHLAETVFSRSDKASKKKEK